VRLPNPQINLNLPADGFLEFLAGFSFSSVQLLNFFPAGKSGYLKSVML
jgi:hypothetical protein